MALPKSQLISLTPGTEHVVWQGTVSNTEQISDAADKARFALDSWRRTPPTERIAIAERFAQVASDRQTDLAESISDETGKPRWEATSEAKLIPAKVKLAVQAYHERTGTREFDLPQGTGAVTYRGLGVVAVLGPFNFPAHLPNGHIVPALIAGNTAVFKPSEWTPGTGELLVKLWAEAGLPEGALQLVQGNAKVGADLIAQNIDGVFFTGSYRGGQAIHRSLAGRPQVLLALEMGGNNPLIIHRADDLDAAAYLSVVSAFTTAGQRCTCARRLILPQDASTDALVEKILALAKTLRVGMPDASPEPFMGPLISESAADGVLSAQGELIDRGAIPLIEATRCEENPALLRPGILDVTSVNDRSDEEVFGPMLQLIRVNDFESALTEANRTAYGLSASLLSDVPELFEQFRSTVRAGVLNWNQPTVGASGRLPFGGLGDSGNHRPSGYFAADYCSDPAAILRSESLSMPARPMPGVFPDDQSESA